MRPEKNARNNFNYCAQSFNRKRKSELIAARKIFCQTTTGDVFLSLTGFFLTLGVIKNTIPLNYSVSHSYILSVVAFDCGQKRSEPLLVTVEVKKACSTGWTGEFLETKLTMSKIKFHSAFELLLSESSGDIIDVASVVKSCQDYTAAMLLGEPGGASYILDFNWFYLQYFRNMINLFLSHKLI